MGNCINSEFRDLKKHKDIPITSYSGLKTKCFISRVLDGDTVEIVIYYNKHYEKHRVRILGIDAPEIHTKNDDEKKCGFIAKTKLQELLAKYKNEASIIVSGNDKYGRLLCDIILSNKKFGPDIYISKFMILNKYAYAYTGKTKKNWGEWEFNRN